MYDWTPLGGLKDPKQIFKKMERCTLMRDEAVSPSITSLIKLKVPSFPATTAASYEVMSQKEFSFSPHTWIWIWIFFSSKQFCNQNPNQIHVWIWKENKWTVKNIPWMNDFKPFRNRRGFRNNQSSINKMKSLREPREAFCLLKFNNTCRVNLNSWF